MDNFLPDNYQVPEAAGHYLKLVKGKNRFRILDSPILGNEYWNKDGRPVRKHLQDPIDQRDIRSEKDGSTGRVKHFWAMPVYSYQNNAVMILELTQKSILKAIKELSSDEEWGNPRQYDLVITREGEGLETEYSVIPIPAKAIDPEITKVWKEVSKSFDLDELFKGGDPFSPGQAVSEDPIPESDEEINIDDINF